MATKYNASSPTREWRYQGHPRITTHCLERWDERMPSGAASPEHAYIHSARVHGLETHPEFDGGRTPTPGGIRVYRGRTDDGELYTAIFIEGGRQFPEDALVTVYSMDLIEDSAVRAYLHAVADQQEGTVDE